MRPLLPLVDRLRAYAVDHEMNFVDGEQYFEFHWERKGSERFIEIDKKSYAVRAGKIARRDSSIEYLSQPTYLGACALEELLDRQRMSADSGR